MASSSLPSMVRKRCRLSSSSGARTAAEGDASRSDPPSLLAFSAITSSTPTPLEDRNVTAARLSTRCPPVARAARQCSSSRGALLASSLPSARTTTASPRPCTVVALNRSSIVVLLAHVTRAGGIEGEQRQIAGRGGRPIEHLVHDEMDQVQSEAPAFEASPGIVEIAG